MSAAVLPALAWALATQLAIGPPVRVLGHSLAPEAPEAGAEADERVVAWAPEGVLLQLSDGGPAGASVERRGSWWVARAPDGGGVRWTFTAPLAAWEAGPRRGPPLVLIHRRAGDMTADTLRLTGIPFEASSPLDGEVEARLLAPAPPAGPLSQPARLWPAALALAAAGALGVLGAGRSAPRLRPGALLSGPAPGAAGSERHALAAALALASRDPAAGAVAVAEALRGHPQATGAGVSPSDTTPEVVRRLPLDGVEDALALADAVKYGGLEPAAEEVVAAGRRAARALDAGRSPHA